MISLPKYLLVGAQSLALLLCVVGGGRSRVSASPSSNEVVRQTMKQRRRRGRARAKMSETAKHTGVTGTWGGAHVRLEARADGATLEFDCARGEIGETFKTDADGRFDLGGTYTRESPGPIRIGKIPSARPARYTGRVEGRTMTLAVKSDAADAPSPPLTFTLTRGSEGRLWKCR